MKLATGLAAVVAFAAVPAFAEHAHRDSPRARFERLRDHAAALEAAARDARAAARQIAGRRIDSREGMLLAHLTSLVRSADRLHDTLDGRRVDRYRVERDLDRLEHEYRDAARAVGRFDHGWLDRRFDRVDDSFRRLVLTAGRLRDRDGWREARVRRDAIFD